MYPPIFYRSLKLRYPLDVEGVSMDGRVTTELGTGSLRHAVGVLTLEDFRTVVDMEQMSILVIEACLVKNEWPIILLNGSANVASKGPLLFHS